MKFAEHRIEGYRVSTFRLPTLTPEADGTADWNSTTMVVVELQCHGHRSIGYSYAHKAAALMCDDLIRGYVMGQDAMNVPVLWASLVRATRNWGRSGLGAMAVSAIDNSLWDLKAKILGLPLAVLFGQVRPGIEVYGSGGFTSYTLKQLEQQVAGWLEQGITKIKMKVGRHPEEDVHRVKAVRKLVGDGVDIFVDANEAYGRRKAVEMGKRFGDFNVKWFEQPVMAEDLEGMAFIRRSLPPSMRLATGEYAHDAAWAYRIFRAEACDVFQPDATRCQGISGFQKIAGAAEAADIPLSSHCAPALHISLGVTVPGLQHLEYFSDHVRMEEILFDRPFQLKSGILFPDLSRQGFGLDLKKSQAMKYAA